MVKLYPLLKPLTDQLMEEVRAYGMLEVSLEQYQTVCNSIVRFAQSSQVDSYSPELMDSYKDNLDTRCSFGEICKEYHRFQLRVILRLQKETLLIFRALNLILSSTLYPTRQTVSLK